MSGINPNSCCQCGKTMIGKRSRGKLIGYVCPDIHCGVASIGVTAVDAYLTARKVRNAREMITIREQ